MFCAPVLRNGLELVVRPEVEDVAALRGTTLAIRSPGRPHAIVLRLRKMGLEGQVATTIVPGEDAGRRGGGGRGGPGGRGGRGRGRGRTAPAGGGRQLAVIGPPRGVPPYPTPE